ncbi:MAG TPA: hypothetical protein VJS87_02015 [Solirubrobacterales bacterium]|nr:hypothetical protein [Solirubrobacterales bacterium]
MIRLGTSLLVLLLGVGAGVGLVACGEDSGDPKLLPAASAEEINSNLDDVEQLLAECELAGAADAAADVRRQIEKVGDQIDPELKDNLLEGTATLEDKIATDDCEAEPAEEPTTETTESETPTEETTAEEPTTEETTEQEPTTEPPTTEPPTTEPPTSEPPAPPPSNPPPSAPPSGGVGPGQSAVGTP